jgi:hypothetical protein
MARSKLTPEDVTWIETRLNQAVYESVPVQPRPEFVQRAKAELMDTPLPEPPNRWRKATLWSALMLIVTAIFVSVLHLRQRGRRD